MSSTNSAPSTWPFDIGIVGLGIVGTHQITREAVEVLQHCRHTFVVESGYGIPEYLKTLCRDVTSLGSLYERGKNRMPTYRKMAAEVVSAAMTKSPVCFAAYGHPWVYCYPTTLITRAAKHLKLHVEVFPGVSSFDTLLVDLGTDIAFDGIQMYEATDLLLRRRPIQNDVTCLIWQATIVGDPTYPDKPFETQQYMPLQNYLFRFYPPSHEVTLVMTRTFPLLRSNVQRFPLNRLATELKKAPQVGTLYIPPTHSRRIEDVELLNRMLATAPVTNSAPPTPSRPGRPVIGPQPTKEK